MNPSAGRFTQEDSFAGFDARPVSLHKYLYANADPANGRDPSGHMTLGEVNTVMGQIGSLSRSTTNLVRFVNKAQNFMDIIDAVKTIGQLAQGGIGGQFSQYLPDTQSAMQGLNVQEATETLAVNIPRIMSRAFPKWITYLSLIRQNDIRSFVVYLPNPTPAMLPQMVIPTPLKIGKKPVKLVAGGRQHAGRLIGVGLDIPRDSPGIHQMWRMDYHGWHRGGGATNWTNSREISIWRDGGYHFHVCKPPQGGGC